MPMSFPMMRIALVLLLTSCGAAPSSAANPPFKSTPVATFDSPWAMTFLPGSGVRLTNAALVTEKEGRIWLVDVTTGRKQPVPGAPRVVAEGQGGLLDIQAAPDFAGSRLVYLTYAEPSANGGSALALARGRLVQDASGARLSNLQVIWRNPEGGEGGGRIVAEGTPHVVAKARDSRTAPYLRKILSP